MLPAAGWLSGPGRDAAAMARTTPLPQERVSASAAGPRSGWMPERLSPTTGFLKDPPPGTCRRCHSHCASSFVHLYLAPSLLEVTPSPALFPRRKGLEHLQAAPQHGSRGDVPVFAGAGYGVRVQGAASCLPKAPNALETPSPANSCVPSNLYPWLSRKTATAPFISGTVDPTKPSLYLRLFPTPLSFSSCCWKLLSACPEGRRGVKRWRVRR